MWYHFSSSVNLRNAFVKDAQLRSPATIQRMELMLKDSVVGFSKLLAQHNSSLSTDSRKLLDDVANYDAFLTLMEVIDSAGMRTADILSLISDANTLAIEYLPFGEENDKPNQPGPFLSATTQEYLQWLHDNLRKTSRTLNVATDYFHTLYDGH